MKDIKTNVPFNEICKSCLFWEKFGESCHFHWKRKKYCTQRVLTVEDKEAHKLLK